MIPADPDYPHLYPYGFLDCKSEWTYHVCVEAHAVYYGRTKDWQEFFIRNFYKYPPRYARPGGVVTAKGIAIPVRDLPGIQCIRLPAEKFIAFSRNASEQKKGWLAEKLVRELLGPGAEEITDGTLQREGKDIFFNGDFYQVKCDYYGGEAR